MNKEVIFISLSSGKGSEIDMKIIIITARLNSIGNSRGTTTEVTIMMQCRTSRNNNLFLFASARSPYSTTEAAMTANKHD